MPKNKKDFPAKSDINPKSSDNHYHQQEEFDDPGKDDLPEKKELHKEGEARNVQQTEQMKDSQEGTERMIPMTKSHERGRDQHPE